MNMDELNSIKSSKIVCKIAKKNDCAIVIKEQKCGKFIKVKSVATQKIRPLP